MQRRSDNRESEACTFIWEIWQYAAIQELDETVRNCLISRILVGKVTTEEGKNSES